MAQKTVIELRHDSPTRVRIVRKRIESGTIHQVIMTLVAENYELDNPDWFQARVDGAFQEAKRIFGGAK
jgi:hypothetical protein